MALQVKIADEKDLVILALEGRVDTFAIEELNHGLEEVKRRNKKNIILMFRDLEYVNSRGIAAFLSFFKWAEAEEAEVKIAEVRPNIMEILKLLGLDTLTRVYDSLSEAMKSFGKAKMEEEMREEREEQEMVVDEEFRRPNRSEGSKIPLLVIAGGVFLLLILLIVYMTRDKGPDLQPIEKRLALVEQKVAQLETQTKDLAAVPGKFDSLKKDLGEKFLQVEKEVSKVRADMEAGSKKVSYAPPGPPTKGIQKAAKYHTVARGETLFSISKKYEISLDELCRLNNLKPNQPISIGQKLIVGSP